MPAAVFDLPSVYLRLMHELVTYLMSSVNVFQECLSVDVSPEGLGLIVEFLLLPARGYVPCQLTPQLPAVCSVRSDRKSAAAAATLAVAVEVF